MLSNKTTLISSTSTFVTKSDAKGVININSEDIKVIFVKSKRSLRKNSTIIENRKVEDEESENSLKSILRNTRKSSSRKNLNNIKKKVKFKDDDESSDNGNLKGRSKLAEIIIVPSYKIFYNNIIDDEENNIKKEKVSCKCICMIF